MAERTETDAAPDEAPSGASGEAPVHHSTVGRSPSRPWAHYSVREQWLDLVRIPQRPHPLMNWRRLVTLAKRTTDFFGHRRVWWNDLLVRINPYPHPFRRVEITSFDGTCISGWLALQPVPRPGLVIVPGMFSSKDDTVHKARAIRAWRRWNYNVLIIELRGFGQSEGSPNTPGWKEAEDVLAAARFLYSFNNVSGIGVLAESLGATAALLAAAQEGIWEERALAGFKTGATVQRHEEDWPLAGEDRSDVGDAGDAASAQSVQSPEPWRLVGARPLMDRSDNRPDGPDVAPPHAAKDVRRADAGGRDGQVSRGVSRADLDVPGHVPRRVLGAVCCFAPFADPRRAVSRISQLPPRTDPFYRIQRLFARLLTWHTAGQHADFRAYMETSAEHYGVTLDELYARSDALRVVRHVRCPTLIVHAEDDPTTDVEHADLFNEQTRDLEQVVVWRMPWGRHCEFDVLDRRWFWRVVGRFMGQWVGR